MWKNNGEQVSSYILQKNEISIATPKNYKILRFSWLATVC